MNVLFCFYVPSRKKLGKWNVRSALPHQKQTITIIFTRKLPLFFILPCFAPGAHSWFFLNPPQLFLCKLSTRLGFHSVGENALRETVPTETMRSLAPLPAACSSFAGLVFFASRTISRCDRVRPRRRSCRLSVRDLLFSACRALSALIYIPPLLPQVATVSPRTTSEKGGRVTAARKETLRL